MIPEKWAEKSPLPPSLPYPVHANSFNFGSAGRKAPSLPPLPSSCKLIQLWFSWQKSPLQIHSTLVQLAEKPPPFSAFS